MSALASKIDKLVTAQCPLAGGTKVVNCVVHTNKPLTDRPPDCKLCTADINNLLRLALDINTWLNEWKDSACKLFQEIKDGGV